MTSLTIGPLPWLGISYGFLDVWISTLVYLDVWISILVDLINSFAFGLLSWYTMSGPVPWYTLWIHLCLGASTLVYLMDSSVCVWASTLVHLMDSFVCVGLYLIIPYGFFCVWI